MWPLGLAKISGVQAIVDELTPGGSAPSMDVNKQPQ